MKPNPRRLDLAVYPNSFDIPTRFSDVDPQWHLNNVRLMEYYQESRILFHRALRDEFDVERERGGRILVAHQTVDYLREVRYPGVVTMAVGILKVGTRSYTIGSAMFQNGQCAGLSATVMVNASKEGTAPLRDQLVTVLQKKRLPEDAL